MNKKTNQKNNKEFVSIKEIIKANKLQEKLFNLIYPKPRKNGKYMKAIKQLIGEM